jgi:hypothetical protein
MSKTKWIRGKEALEIIHELAEGVPHDVIAENHGRARQSIDNFSAKHDAEVQAFKQDQNAQLKGSWLGDQRKRRAELEAKYAELQEVIDGLRGEFFVEDPEAPGGEKFTLNNYNDAEEARKTIALWSRLQTTQILIINKAAEEAGDLPQRKKNEGGPPEEVSWDSDGVGDDVGS